MRFFFIYFSVLMCYIVEMANCGTVAVNCNTVLTTVTSCFQRLEERINITLLTTYNRTYDQIIAETSSQQNFTYYVTLAVRDEVCRSSNQATIDCLVSNLVACPEVIISTSVFLFTDYYLQNQTDKNTTAQLCAYYRTEGCEARKKIFIDCYGFLLPEFQTDVTPPTSIGTACLPEVRRTEMNCMIDSYKECEQVIFQDLSLFNTLRDEIFDNNWQQFNNGEEVCSCAIKSSCQQRFDNALALFAFRSGIANTVKDEFIKVFDYAETICRFKEDVKCSYTSFAPLCNITTYKTRVTNYKRYYDFTLQSCTGIENQDFKDKQQCVINKLAMDLPACYNFLPSEARNPSCSEMQYIHTCINAILYDDECGAVSTMTILEIFQDYYQLPKTCVITSNGVRRQHEATQLSVLLAIVYVLNLCIT